MKKTAFNEIHKKYGAKMVEFAGFEMPVQYKKGIISEHKAVREKVGVFDVSHMGEFEIEGKDALAFVQKITVNDASKLSVGAAQYSAMCLENGGLIDDLLVYRLGENKYMTVVNAANIEKDFAWAQKNAEGFDISLKNVSDEINLLAVQGPKSLETLDPLTDVDMSRIKFYRFEVGKIAGVEAIISRTGYTGELGFEIYFRGDLSDAEKLWNAIFESGEKFGVEPAGLGARDTLRLEKGYCLYGNDIDETTNPIEAGLSWIVKLDKGDFNGKEAVAKVKAEGPKRRLVGFVGESEKFIPRHGYPITDGEKEIGVVTSGNLSPVLGKPIGMGYVAIDYKAPGTKIEIAARGKKFPFEVVKLPFV